MGKRIKKGKIFVQMASYRDPELKPTLKDMFANADFPDNLVVCIAHQFNEEDEWDNLDEYKDDKRLKILSIPYTETKGACWARNKIQQEYDQEEYTLQLDSHHRFVKGWDTKIITMYEDLKNDGYKKPLLTGYIPSYNPQNDPAERNDKPWGMKFDRFTPEGVVFFMPYHLDNPPLKPVPARFFSAHFAFTTGKFCEEVPHDPNLYFHGEEISLAVRAYTYGYDLFHPNKIIAWHEYTRVGRTKNWDDNKEWHQQNMASHERMRKLLGVDGECAPCQRKKLFPQYGLGEVRTLGDYEHYAGIRFSDRGIRQSTLDNVLPGTADLNEPYNAKFRHALDLHGNDFPRDDYDFIAIICEDKDGKELYRKDFEDFQNRIIKDSFFVIWIEANIEKPHKIVCWSHSKSAEWVERKDLLL